MKRFIPILALLLFSLNVVSQTEIKGTIRDAATNETIIGATVLISEGKGVVSDIDGNYSLKIDNGQYTMSVSFVGYEQQKIKVNATGKTITININLNTLTLNEVEIVADVAKTRETPIAFSNITAKQIQEELNSRDIVMLLNSTPGAYATEQGGGSGDARVTIRGFDQRNVAVMVDGVPINDMENGWVYWSNWDGLGDVTRNVQVQRGLGASKLAIASVGGTMNIITKGIDSKKEISVKQELMSDLTYKTSLAFNTGQLKNGWGLTGSFSRKFGDGYVEQTWTDAFSYFLKIQKRLNKHLISLSGNGAPQSHGQRSTQLPIAIYNKKFAESLGINADSALQASQYASAIYGSHGIRFNPHWGYLNGKAFNERINYFHKPQITLSDFWNINKKLYLSTVMYASFGNGGGTKLINPIYPNKQTGEIDFQTLYNSNSNNKDALYSTTENKSTNIIQSSVNKHQWYGLLSSLNYNIDSNFTATFGIDARYYKGIHYKEVYDLMGGDYYINNSNANQPVGMYPNDPNFQYSMKRKGDKILTDYEGKVMWGGIFAQIEYKKQKWSAFVTGSISETGYQRKDYFRKKDLVLSDTTLSQVIGFADVITYNGVQYDRNSPEAKTSTTKRKWFLGYTAKAGANYNINGHQNIFINAGYLKMAPKFDLVFTTTNLENTKVKMTEVVAAEIGYGIKYKKFASNINLYYTSWRNKPLSEFPTIRISGNDYYYQLNGLNANHSGIELDFIYKLSKNLDIEGLASIGDWTTQTQDEVYLFDVNTDLIYDTVQFSAKGIHVGDAAQIQLGGSIRYEIVKNLFIKARYTYFAKNYSKFALLDLGVTYNTNGTIRADNRDRESWKIPDYGLLDLFAGYNFNYWKLRFTISAGVTNALNTVYINDAMNGSGFNASSSIVYMGTGTKFNIGLKISF